MKKLALITVIFKNYTILDEYFLSLSKQTDNDFHVFAVDVSETPQNYAFPPFVTCIRGANHGYASGINRGTEHALAEGFEMVAPMNSDVTVKPDFIEQIKKSITQNPSSIIGAKIYYYPGCEYHKERYSKDEQGNIFWYAGGIIDWDNIYTTHRGVDEVDKGQYNTQEKTSFITGCFMAYDTSVIKKIGEWDEGYFLFYEDADYSVRATRAGIPLIYCPSIVVWHKSGQSTNGAASSFQQAYHEKNRIRFGLKYGSLRTKIHLLKNQIMKVVNNGIKH